MSLSIGLVGLPNVGKSTLFNALTQAQNAEAANYPFCTIEPNKAIVTVPDKRVDTLGELVKVSVQRAQPVGRLTGWKPSMTVTQLSLVKR